MNTIIEFDAISYSGQPVSVKKEMVCPNFEIKNIKNNLPNIPFEIHISIEEQIMDWLDNIDKSDIMYEYDLGIIINYKVISVIDKNGIILVNEVEPDYTTILKNLFKDTPEMLFDYIAVYTEMKDVVKDLPFMDQFKIVMKGVGVAALSKIDAFKHMSDLLKSESLEEIQLKIKKYNNRKNNLLE